MFERKGLWLKLQHPVKKCIGWAVAEIDDVKYLRPSFPGVVYPWQRARHQGGPPPRPVALRNGFDMPPSLYLL